MTQFKLLLITAAFFCTKAFTQSTTVTLGSVADNSIYAGLVNNSNALGENIFSGTNGGAFPRRGLIRFDIAASIPAGSTITAVTLTLHCNFTRAVADSVRLHKLNAGWGEGTSNAGGATGGDGGGVAATTNDATWNTRFYPNTNWAAPGGDFEATASAGTSINNTGFFSWSSPAMVADVQGWLNNSASDFGWVLICNEIAASTARKFGSKENPTLANRPALQITYISIIPVKLAYFTATTNDGKIKLNWKTEQELNNDYFEILHSTDGSNFKAIAKVNGKGNSSIPVFYQYDHSAPKEGSNFYRLVQWDFNGHSAASNIVHVIFNSISGKLVIAPNPAMDYIFLTLDMKGKYEFAIYKPNGSMIQNGGLNNDHIPIYNLEAGAYFLCIYENKQRKFSELFYKQ